jgi:hypothetical protein
MLRHLSILGVSADPIVLRRLDVAQLRSVAGDHWIVEARRGDAL